MSLLRRFDAINSAADILDLQLALVNEIKAAEQALSTDQSSSEYRHRHLARRLGDAIAWRCLHPYSIRQLYLGAAAPPSITRQDRFSTTLEVAGAVTKRGIPALIADITYCLGTGDVIVADHPERPSIVECGNPRFVTAPRKQRQMLRANAALTQLRDGVAQWPDRARPTITREVLSEGGHVFDTVAEVVEAASNGGAAIRQVNDQQTVFALSADSEIDDFAVGDLGAKFDKPAFVITTPHERRPSPRIAPTYIWPVSVECRTAVSEKDVLVGQVVDLGALEGLSSDGAQLVAVEMRRDDVFITAERGQVASLITSDPIHEALGNYESFESMASNLLGGVLAIGNEPDVEVSAANDHVPAEWGIPEDLVEKLRIRSEELRGEL